MGITVREARSDEEREQIFRLRYEIYVDEMRRRQPFADHAQRTIREPFDDTAHLLVAEDDGVTVGTVRVNHLKDGPLECQELYGLEAFGGYYPDAIGMNTKLMVRRSHRGTAAAGKLVAESYRVGRENGIKLDFIDTNPHLVRLYQHMGYRFYKDNIQHPSYGSVLPMVLFAGDLPYLEAVGSPFVPLARQYDIDRDAESFFQSRFPRYASIRPAWTLTEEALWLRYAEALGLGVARRCGFLKDLDEAEVRLLLGHMDPIQFGSGDRVIEEGQDGNGMFCILEGQAEIVVKHPGGERVVDIVQAGDVFGEMGFIANTRRNASVVAREATAVLVLTAPELKKFATKHPATALKLLTGLFTVAVERFNARVGQDGSRDDV